MIAAIYVRKSTEQTGVSDDARSVARQIDHARQYAKSKGWSVDERCIFVDDGISGAEFANRPGLMKLMASLKPRPAFHVLIVSELSRLGRETFETGYVLKQLDEAGVKVFAYLEDKPIALSSATDKFLMSAVAFAADIEREKARQRTRDALVRKAKAGHVAGGRVFGYDNVVITDASGHRSHVERTINKDEAATVVRMFEQAARGKGIRSICRLLNDEHAPCPRSQRGRPKAWAPSSVRAVLHRQLYRGIQLWATTKKRDGWGKVHQVNRPQEEWIRTDAPKLRIVSEQLWAEAHARLGAKSAAYLRANDGKLHGRPEHRAESKYLLPGIGRCATCGGGLLVKSRSHGKHRVPFYACSSYHLRGREVCKVNVEDTLAAVDKAVLDCFDTLLTDPALVERVLDVADDMAKPARKTVKADKAAMQKALTKVEGEIARLTDAIASGADVKALVGALKAREGEADRLRKALNHSEVIERRADASPSMLREQLRERLTDWRGVLRRNPTVARAVIRKLIDGPLTFTGHRDEQGRGYFTFEGTASFGKVLENLPIVVTSPAGFEPAFWP